jgi:hypothetical protein
MELDALNGVAFRRSYSLWRLLEPSIFSSGLSCFAAGGLDSTWVVDAGESSIG